MAIAISTARRIERSATMPAVTRLLLDERIVADGSTSRSWATAAGTQISLSDDDGISGQLSVAALDRVMCRYGQPIDDAIALDASTAALDFASGHRLSRLRYRARVDAEGRDYLVWQRPGEPPLAVLATHAAAALRYLVLRLSGERSQETET
jgi:hypothetical protein